MHKYTLKKEMQKSERESMWKVLCLKDKVTCRINDHQSTPTVSQATDLPREKKTCIIKLQFKSIGFNYCTIT